MYEQTYKGAEKRYGEITPELKEKWMELNVKIKGVENVAQQIAVADEKFSPNMSVMDIKDKIDNKPDVLVMAIHAFDYMTGVRNLLNEMYNFSGTLNAVDNQIPE